MAAGFAYLVAIMDVFSRKILSWRVSNSADVRFCLNALTEALDLYSAPEVFNTDRGAQFASTAFTQVLLGRGARISRDSKGSWIDNVSTLRFWRSVKYEEVYLHGYADLSEARLGLSNYMGYYSGERRHSSLERRPPDEVYAMGSGVREFVPEPAASGPTVLGPCSWVALINQGVAVQTTGSISARA